MQRLAKNLSFGRKLLLAADDIAAVAGLVVFGLVYAPQIRAQAAQTTGAPLPSFEVASIKPNHSGERRRGFGLQPDRFTATNVTTKMLVTFAYNIRDLQVSGGPSWMDSTTYNIDAREEGSIVEKLKSLPRDQRRAQIRLMVQSLLADRFKLIVSRETQDLPVYALVVAKNGPKLHEARPGDTYPNGIKGLDGRGHAGMVHSGGDHISAQGISITSLNHDEGSLVDLLSQQLGRTVLDQTGLKGKYDIALKWTPDQNPDGMVQGPDGGRPGAESAPPPDSSGPSIFTAIQEQLGLKLEPTKGPVDVIVIDHIERPSAN